MAYEGIIQGSAKEFVAYYQSEIQRQVENIRDIVKQLRQDSSNRAFLEEIQAASAAIADLAMVYGFEGVEVIADRIHTAVRKLQDEEITDEFLIRLEEATGAIEKAMILIDERREREIVRGLSSQSPDSGDFSFVEPAVSDENPEDMNEGDAFEIKEDEKLLSILTDADGEAYEIQGQDVQNLDSEEVSSPGEEAEFRPLESEELSDHFEEEKKGETVFEELDIEEGELELDFHREASPRKKRGGFWGKISHIFGSKENKETVSDD